MTGQPDFRAAGGQTVRRCLIACCAISLCALALAGCRQPGFGLAADTAAPPVYAALPNQPMSYLGVYERGLPGAYTRVGQFAQAVGRRPNLVLYYSGWSEKFQTTFARMLYRHGATPLIDLEPTKLSMASIAQGLSDDYLRSYASQIRGFGHPVIISFAHEMNGNWYRWGWTRTSPAVWIEAWQRVVTIFRAVGADNVTWLWTVNRVSAGEGPIRDWWPGAAYVTWVGMDGYFQLPTDTFASVFDPTITAIRDITRKPILLAETAVGQVGGQSAKIPGLFAGVRSSGLLGFLWFDKAQHNGIHHQDWRLEGDTAAVAAFRQGLRGYRRAST